MDVTTDSKLNSGNYADISDSVNSSSKNFISLDNAVKYLNYKNLFLMGEPTPELKKMFNYIFTDTDYEYTITRDYVYRPEGISEQFYKTPDLWYMIMIRNKLYNVMQLTEGLTIFIPKEERVKKYIARLAQMQTIFKENKANPPDVTDWTIKKIVV